MGVVVGVIVGLEAEFGLKVRRAERRGGAERLSLSLVRPDGR
jgi:hypothetical protein